MELTPVSIGDMLTPFVSDFVISSLIVELLIDIFNRFDQLILEMNAHPLSRRLLPSKFMLFRLGHACLYS